MGTPVVLSYGMGVDSTSILLRWLDDPSSRWFDLDDLIVLVAMTGDEWQRTGELVETHVLPRLADRHVRLVQVARAGLSHARDGIVVLDDSRRPNKLHLGGAYRLSEELLAAGTIPLSASGQRRCSIKAKGEVLDAAIADLVGGAEFDHAVGFEAGEQRRADRDRGYGTAARQSRYPLIEWGWGRDDCSAYIARLTGVDDWPKSACVFCPFAANLRNRQVLLDRYRNQPDAAVLALRIEHRARALNPNMTLFSSTSVASLLADAGQVDLLGRFDAALADEQWALYEVRRILLPATSDPSRFGRGMRQTAVVASGSHREMVDRLRRLPDGELDPAEPGEGSGIWRRYARRRGPGFPTVEQFYVVAPAGIDAKSRPDFDRRWGELTGDGRLFGLLEAS